MLAMEFLKRIFEQESLPVRLLRNQGLKVLNELPFIKQNLLKQVFSPHEIMT